MEHKFMLTDELLWDYADGLLNADEKLRVDAFLRQFPEQQARLDAVLTEKRAFATLPLDKPNAGFAQQVMAAWAAEQAPAVAARPAKTKGPDWIMWGLAAVLVLMLVLPIALSPSFAAVDSVVQLTEEYRPQLQVPTFDWAGFFGSALVRNGLLLLLGYMSLQLLDKYLQVRNLRLSAPMK